MVLILILITLCGDNSYVTFVLFHFSHMSSLLADVIKLNGHIYDY